MHLAEGQLPGDGLALLADDLHGAGVVQTVENQIHHLGDNIHGNDGIHGAFIVLDGQSVEKDDGRVQDQHDGAEVQLAEALTQELCHNVDAAGGGAVEVDHAEGETLEHAADDAGQHGVPGEDQVRQGEEVHKGGGQTHAQQGTQQKVQPEVTPGNEEKGNVHHDHHDADGPVGEGVDDHGDAGDAAGDDVVGKEKGLKDKAVE